MTGLPVLPDPDTTTLTIPADLDFDTWTALAAQVFAAAEHSMWWVGDLLAYAEDHYADGGNDSFAMAKVLDVISRTTTLAPTELWDARDTARRDPPAQRRRRLSWRHYARLAQVEAEPQLADQLLEVAEREGWTVEQLDAERRRWGAHDATATDTGPEPPAVTGRIRLTCPPGTDPQVVGEVVEDAARYLIRRLDARGLEGTVKT